MKRVILFFLIFLLFLGVALALSSALATPYQVPCEYGEPVQIIEKGVN